MSGSKSYSIIIVNYRSKKSLVKCLASVFDRIKESPPEVIVVNNDSEERLEDLTELYPAVIMIKSSANVGYGKANNLGSKRASGKFLFFLNPDTEILNFDTNLIFNEFDKDNNIGVIGLKIVENDGSVQPWTVGKEVGWFELLANNLGFSRSRKIWKNPIASDVDWVSGTAMIVEKSTFLNAGGFDEKFFMYFEDMDLCKRIRLNGKNVVYRPSQSVAHSGGSSYGLRIKDQKKDYYRSQDYYFQKHLGTFDMFLLRLLRKTFGK